MGAYKNFSYSQIAVAPSPATTGTSIALNSGDGDEFLDPAVSGEYNIVIWPVNSLPLSSNAEIAKVTAKTGDVLTIVRAQEGSVARTVIIADQIMHAMTAKTFTDLEALIADVQDNLDTHEALTNNPHSVTKTQVGLENVDNTSDANKPVSTATQTALDGKSDEGHDHVVADVTDFASATDTRIDDKITTHVGQADPHTQYQKESEKGSALGYAELDASGKVPSAQLPSYVDDVVEYADFASLPVTGEASKIYVTLDDDTLYRWSGTIYVSLGSAGGSLVLGETNTTAYRGDRGKTAYDHSQVTSGNPHSVTKTEVGLGNVDNTSDANKPVSTAQQTALDGKQPIDADLTAIAGLTPSNDDIIQRKAGSWVSRTMAQLKIDLALTKSDVGLSNVPDVDATDRDNHTGTQLASTISDFASTVLSTVLTGLSLATGTAISATDTALVAFGKLQKQITDNLSTLTSHTGNTSNPHSVTKAQVGLGNADDTSDVNKPVSTAQQTAIDAKVQDSISNGETGKAPSQNAVYDALALKEDTANKGVSGGYASLDGGGKIPTSQLPALALTDVFSVASQVAQLALTAEEGDVAIRTDLNKSYIHNGGVAGTMADWSELLTPTDTVVSVNGETGAVTLTTDDISDSGQTNKWVTAGEKADIALIDSKADDSAVVHLTGNESIAGHKTFTDGIYDEDGTPKLAIDPSTRKLYIASGHVIFDWENGIIYDFADIPFLDSSARVLKDSNGDAVLSIGSNVLYSSNAGSPLTSINWDARILYDTSGEEALNWQNRHLLNSSSDPILVFSGTMVAFRDPVGGNYVEFDVSSITGNHVITLQDASGTLAFLSDIAGLAEEGANSDITSLLGLTGEIRLDATPASDDIVTGLSTASFVAGETLAEWDLVYMNSDSKWWKADASDVVTAGGMLGIAVDAGTADVALIVGLPSCFIRNDGWAWTPGATLYADITAGGITETAPSGTDEVVRVIGFAMSADIIHFNPSPNHIIHT